jgi:hypothetical protein
MATVLIGAGPASRPASPEGATNPHWSPSGCQVCHDSEADKPHSISRERIDKMCLKCHDGRRAPREIHPVGRRFVPDEIVQSSDWPAPDGRLGCVTCHDIRRACDRSKRRPAVNPVFLRLPPRGTEGGFCGACHIAAVKVIGGRYNPHAMLNDKGESILDACLFCHDLSFDPRNRTTRTDDARLRADGIGLCIGCHPQHRDYFEPGHIGLRVPPGIMSNILVAAPPATRPESSPQTQPAMRERTRIPLDEGRRIVCFTCHNPHPRGVFTAGSELSNGEMTDGSQNRLALRGPGKDVCSVCHKQ